MRRLTIVGLGSGAGEQISLGIWNRMKSGKRLFLRTKEHPAVEWLDRDGVAYESFDDIYEQHATFERVYDTIAERLVAEVEQSNDEVVYAVPGHPMIAEKSVQLLKALCNEKNIDLNIIGGQSFLDQAFSSFGFDPIEGFTMLDGTDISAHMLNPELHTVIAQIYDQQISSDVKLTLMEVYPDDYPILVGSHLGVEGKEIIKEIKLYELDRLESYGNLFMVYIAKTDQTEVVNRRFDRLHEIVQILRSPGGCPWDREQTHQSIRRNLIEETYEVLETIDDDDPDAMREELGDLMLQVMLHSQMEEEEGVFNVYDVISTLNEKLIRRHPHVFGSKEAENAEDALRNWDEMKKEEKKKRGLVEEHSSLLDGVPRDLPGLLKALEYQKKAAKVGFDWDNFEDVFAKIKEELEELREILSDDALEEKHLQERREEELGDLLFSIVNAARFLKIDPESAITQTNRKFYHRFSYIENQLRLKGKKIEHTNLIEMEDLWQEAKKL